MEILIWIAILIIAVLASVAGYYLVLVHKQTQRQNQEKQRKLDEQQQQKSEIAGDIQFIAAAMLQKQCEITEGCIRLKHLLDAYDFQLQHESPFSSIYQYYDSVADMPIKSAYKALTKQEQFKWDKKRFRLEQEFEANIIDAVGKIATYPGFPQESRPVLNLNNGTTIN